MPWSIQQRDGKYCVIKDADGHNQGCHSSRADAVKQMRALYANESRMASLYTELDAQEEERLEQTPPDLTASVVRALDVFGERMQASERATEALISALDRDTVVNVAAPNVTVEPPEVTVQAPSVKVDAPNIEVLLPSERKSVKFTRDPYGAIIGAEVEES